ncbi:hypothetical protein IFR05_008094, partial [Cadophora sp. M221]
MPQARINALQPHIDVLYSTLGYDIHAYFTAYEEQVGILGSKDTLSNQIVLCATKYLAEESRGQRFWPENRRGILVWPTNEQLVTAFTTEWLQADNSPWPEVADVTLQMFMHNCEFYAHCNYDEYPTLDLINILRKGSEIETLENGRLYVVFQNRIRDRVEFLTHKLTKAPYCVLEFRRDRAAQMTK